MTTDGYFTIITHDEPPSMLLLSFEGVEIHHGARLVVTASASFGSQSMLCGHEKQFAAHQLGGAGHTCTSLTFLDGSYLCTEVLISQLNTYQYYQVLLT